MSILQPDGSEDRQSKKRKLSHSNAKSIVDSRFPGVESGSKASTDANSHENGDNVGQKSNKSVPSPSRSARRTTSVPVEGSTKSSLLAVQLRDLLDEVTPDYDGFLSTFSFVEKIKSAIREVSARQPSTVVDAEKVLRGQGVVIPWPSPRPTKDSNLKFGYDTPASITTAGSLVQKLSVKGVQQIDIDVTMPEALLQEKDFLNLRAFHKRAYYLACIAAELVGSGDFESEFCWKDGLELLPQLQVSSSGAKKPSKIEYLINVCFPSGSIPQDKTLPDKNCVRPKDNSDSGSLEPTPFYNSCILEQASFPRYNVLLTDAAKQCENFADACRLGQIWLQQRSYTSSIASGGFGAREWAITCALLLKTGGHKGAALLSPKYSSLQLFKAMLQILSARDLTEPWILDGNNLTLERSEVPILLDGTTGVNILYKMNPWSHQNLRRHAKSSLASLNSKDDNAFNSTFIVKTAEPMLQYDEVLHVKIPEDPLRLSYLQQPSIHRLHQVLKQGLSDRADQLDLRLSPRKPFPVQKSSTHPKFLEIVIGLTINSETTSRLIDHGPSADDREDAADFRKFWGEKSELRRFKDGSINESLVWASDKPVVYQIVTYLLNRHFGVSSDSIVSVSSKLEDKFLLTTDPSTTATFNLIRTQFQTLSSTLHGLDDLPLPIRSISPADPAFRSASLHSPLYPPTSQPISVIIQFDSSTRWPDSLPAIQHTKIAFLAKLSDLLTTQDPTLTTRLGLENSSASTTGYLNTSFLDITLPIPHPSLTNLTFRLRIHHDREPHLLSSLLNSKLQPPTPSHRTTLSSALQTYTRTFLATPAHTTTLSILTTRFPPLSPTIRLLKSWLAAHLLLRSLPPEPLEIIAAHIFLHPSPWPTPPVSPTTAFLRVLHFLASWDWVHSPIIVDLGLGQDNMTVAKREELKTRFEAWRKTLDPNFQKVSWFVGSSVDETGVVWTLGRVERGVAGRVRALAEAGMGVLRAKGTAMEEGDWEGLFKSHVSLEEFDFLIHLEEVLVRGGKKGTRKVKGKYKNLQIDDGALTASDVSEGVGFDPVELYVEDLEQAFGGVALFMYNSDGGKVVAGKWRPSVMGPGGEMKREWRVRLGWSSRLVETGGDDHDGDDVVVDGDAGGEGKEKVTCEFNKEGVLKEMEILGERLVKNVEWK